MSSWPDRPGKRYLLPPENPTTSWGSTGPTMTVTSLSTTSRLTRTSTFSARRPPDSRATSSASRCPTVENASSDHHSWFTTVEAVHADQRPQLGVAHRRVGPEGHDRRARTDPPLDRPVDRPQQQRQRARAGGVGDHEAQAAPVEIERTELLLHEAADRRVVEHRVGPAEDRGHAASSSTAGPSRVSRPSASTTCGRERSIGAERRDEGVDVGARGRVGQPRERHPAHGDASDGSHPDRGHEGEPIRAEAELPTAGDHRQQPLPELLRAVGPDLRARVAQVRVGEAAECLLGERPRLRRRREVGHLQHLVDQQPDEGPHADVRHRLGDRRAAGDADRRRRTRSGGRSAATACGARTAPCRPRPRRPRRPAAASRSVALDHPGAVVLRDDRGEIDAAPRRSATSVQVSGGRRRHHAVDDRARERHVGRDPPAERGVEPVGDREDPVAEERTVADHVVERGDDRCGRTPRAGGPSPAAITAAAGASGS